MAFFLYSKIIHKLLENFYRQNKIEKHYKSTLYKTYPKIINNFAFYWVSSLKKYSIFVAF